MGIKASEGERIIEMRQGQVWSTKHVVCFYFGYISCMYGKEQAQYYKLSNNHSWRLALDVFPDRPIGERSVLTWPIGDGQAGLPLGARIEARVYTSAADSRRKLPALTFPSPLRTYWQVGDGRLTFHFRWNLATWFRECVPEIATASDEWCRWWACGYSTDPFDPERAARRRTAAFMPERWERERKKEGEGQRSRNADTAESDQRRLGLGIVRDRRPGPRRFANSLFLQGPSRQHEQVRGGHAEASPLSADCVSSPREH